MTESSLVVSLLFIGGFVGNFLKIIKNESMSFVHSFFFCLGNFIILPISNFIGIKSAIHIFGLPLFVRIAYTTKMRKKMSNTEDLCFR